MESQEIDSDDNDEDYKPIEKDKKDEDISDTEEITKGRGRKRTKFSEDTEKTPSDISKVDSIWQEMKTVATSDQMKNITQTSNINEKSQAEASHLQGAVKMTEKLEFAGEIIEVTKEVPVANKPPPPKKKGNLDNLLANLGKPKKISTTQKTALDWQKFKKQEGIEDELATKATNGYLEKQAFLQRTDVRQFERERDIRQAKRKH